MKITNPEGLQQIRPENVHSKNDSIGSTGFGNVLRKALEKPELNSDVKETARLPELRSVQSFGDSKFRTGYMDRTSRVIDLMESYAKSLSNPKKTLKDIEPELMTFIEAAQSLREEFVNSGNADAGLKDILEDLLRTARLERARFNRGDYLDSDG